MISVAEAVRTISQQSAFAQEGLRSGLLNLSQYAESIHEQVEKYCKKPVRIGTIVVSLNRLQKSMYAQEAVPMPTVEVLETYIHADLDEWVFPNTPVIHKELTKLLKRTSSDSSLPSITRGIHQVTVVLHKRYRDFMEKNFSMHAVSQSYGLSSVTMVVADAYIDTPGLFYKITSDFFAQQISIVELFTADTEITITVRSEDTSTAVKIVQRYAKA